MSVRPYPPCEINEFRIFPFEFSLETDLSHLILNIMPIIFNKVERANPQDRTVPKKWYPSLKRLSQVSEKEVAKEIADETTLNRKEAEMALGQLEKVLIRDLLSGNSVQLGDWGSFYLTCNGEGRDTKEGVTVADIKNLNIRFMPGKALKEALKSASFVFSEDLVSGK
jgi:predicted histone-like DNA-binding protein